MCSAEAGACLRVVLFFRWGQSTPALVVAHCHEEARLQGLGAGSHCAGLLAAKQILRKAVIAHTDLTGQYDRWLAPDDFRAAIVCILGPKVENPLPRQSRGEP